MAQAGCELLENTVDKAAMGFNGFTQVARFYKLIKRIERFMADNKVDLVIVCDSPSFNFHVAKAGKKAGAKTLFFVAPQLWAWEGLSRKRPRLPSCPAREPPRSICSGAPCSRLRCA